MPMMSLMKIKMIAELANIDRSEEAEVSLRIGRWGLESLFGAPFHKTKHG